jgi:hypothetical protein
MPSIAYAFLVTPCDPDRRNDWDNKIGSLIKHKFKFMKGTSTAMIKENKDDFGLRCHSISVEYHRQNAEALKNRMNHKSHRHKCITEKLLRNQIALLRQKAFDLQAQHGESSIPLRRLLGFNMRVRKLLSIKLSNMCVIEENNGIHISEDLRWISALVSSKRIMYKQP